MTRTATQHRVPLIPLAAAVLALTITAVGLVLIGGRFAGATHQDAPDPAPGNVQTGTHEFVIEEPDGFRNVVFSCHGRDGIYVTSRGVPTDVLPSGIAVVANDPNCVP